MGLREVRRFQFTCDVCGTKAIHETTEAESRTDMIGGVSVSVSLADTQWREIVPRDLDECERFEAWAWARGLRKTIRKGSELPRRYLACSVCAARAAQSFGKGERPDLWTPDSGCKTCEHAEHGKDRIGKVRYRCGHPSCKHPRRWFSLFEDFRHASWCPLAPQADEPEPGEADDTGHVRWACTICKGTGQHPNGIGSCCAGCDGTGRVLHTRECPTCNGAQSCEDCDEGKQKRCRVCDGYGCANCDDEGWIPLYRCEECGGAGQIGRDQRPCPVCEGRGHATKPHPKGATPDPLRELAAALAPVVDFRERRCLDCGGKGESGGVPCKRCEGSGLVVLVGAATQSRELPRAGWRGLLEHVKDYFAGRIPPRPVVPVQLPPDTRQVVMEYLFKTGADLRCGDCRREDERTIGVDPGADRPRAALVTGPEALAALGFGNPLETASTRGAVEAVARMLGVSPDEANELAEGCAHVRHEYHNEPDEGWLCDDCGRWRPKEDGQFPEPADDYAPETHLLAVELRALGMDIPREIPGAASILRCGLSADVGELVAQPDGSVAGALTFEASAPFVWIDADGNECQEWIKPSEGGDDGTGE